MEQENGGCACICVWFWRQAGGKACALAAYFICTGLRINEARYAKFYNCLDFCEVYNRLPYFYVTGGDPILHPDFWRLLELLHDDGIPFTILGNPFHLNDQICRELKAYGCEKYQLSIDGLRETHDWFRKPGSDKAIPDTGKLCDTLNGVTKALGLVGPKPCLTHSAVWKKAGLSAIRAF